MKITPLEIRQKSFEKAFRGINKEEVNAFLMSLSHEWERMLDENKVHKNQIEKLEKEVQKLREVENTLFRTLKTAEDTGAHVIDQANRTAQLHMKETQINAEGMINDAKNKARAIIDRAEGQAKEVLEEMGNEVKGLEENYRIIESQKDSVISQLKILSGEMMSKVEKVKYQESGIETHLKKVKQLLRDTTNRIESKIEEVDFDDIQIKKTPLKKIVENKIEVTSMSPLSSNEAPEKFEVSNSDKEQVKKNFIPESNPISRKPVAKSKPQDPEKKSAGSDLSFFDQLED